MKSRIEKNHDPSIVEDLKHKQQAEQIVATEDTQKLSAEDKERIRQLYEQYVSDDKKSIEQVKKKHNINLFLNRSIIILTLLLIIILVIAFFF